MTIADAGNRIQYTGNGATSVYSTGSIIFYANTDLVVKTTVIATGVSATLALTTDYTVTGGSGASGSITLVAGALPSTKRITIERAIPYTQTDDYVEGENILAATVETAFDKSVIRDQQLRDSINRTLKLPSTTTFSGSLDVPEPVASKIIGWNSAGTALENKSLADIDASLDTVITSITSGDILQWDGSNWVNVAGTSTSFVDNVFTIKDNGDNTKQVAFEASAITTGTTRTISVPDANLTLVGTATTQTLTNKTLTAPVISTITNVGTLTLPTSTGTLALTSQLPTFVFGALTFTGSSGAEVAKDGTAISSVTRNSAGVYTVTLAASYTKIFCSLAWKAPDRVNGHTVYVDSASGSSVVLHAQNYSGGAIDSTEVTLTVHAYV